MAKQLVHPIEKHVEKIVLGLAGLVLIAVVAIYIVTSPNQIEVGGQPATPRTIHQRVAQKAADVRDRIQRAPVKGEIPEPLFDQWRQSLDPFQAAHLATTLPAGVGLEPDVPIIDPPEPVTGQKDLVEVVPTGPPKFTTGRSTLLVGSKEGDQRLVADNWVTLSVVFKVKEQMAAQSREYGAARREVVFGPVELQRRARREGGQWSDDDWEYIQPWPATTIPPVPNIQLVQEDERIIVPRKDRAAIERFLETLRQPEKQLNLLRPLMLSQANGDPWTFPVLTSERDVLVQDDFYLHPKKPPAADPESRYAPVEEATLDEQQLSPEELLAKAKELLQTAYANKSRDQATEAYNLARTVEDDESLSRGLRRRAGQLSQQAEQTDNDIKLWLDRGGHATSTTEETERSFKREPVPIQQLWVHDAQPGSVESGQTYQYRLRPLIFNRLAGEPDNFRDKSDATILFIPGEWSAPVEVDIPRDTVFFVTSQDNRNQQVGVEFYKWFQGVWVKSRRFKYAVGDRVAGVSRSDVPSLDDPSVTENYRVEYSTDATIVDIDFKRAFRERKRGTSRRGVKFTSPKPTCAMVFADADGRLHERMVPTEKRHPDKRLLSSKVFKPPRDK